MPINASKLGLRPEEAGEVLGSRELLENCRRAGWIKPVVQKTRLTIYSYGDLVKCWTRIERGEVPPARVRAKK